MSDPTQNQNDQVLTPPSSVTVQADIPPMPSFSDANSTPPANIATTTTTTTNFFPPSADSSSKKQFGGKKIIATFLGVLLLIGGITAGIVLITQPQLLQQKASTTGYTCGEGGITCGYYCESQSKICSGGVCSNGVCINMNSDPKNCGSYGNSCASGNICSNGKCSDTSTDPMNCGLAYNVCQNGEICSSGNCIINPSTSCKTGDLGAPVCCAGSDTGCSGGQIVCEGGQGAGRKECYKGGTWCTMEVNSSWCGNPQPTGNPSTPPQQPTPTPVPLCNSVCTTTSQCLAGQTCSIPTGSTSGNCRNPNCVGQANCLCPTPTPSPTPGPTAVCTSVKAYDSAWNQLTATQLSSLKSGNNIIFCVAGTTSSSTFDMARFTLNGVLQADTTTKRPTTNDFCQAYTIPANVYTFNVTAQIHHVVLGWVGP